MGTLTKTGWMLLAIHSQAFTGVFLIHNIAFYTVVLQMAMYSIGVLGVTAGYHRLWCHQSYKASRGLEWLLMIFGTTSGQGTALWWCKGHRTHHRNEDKLADPYSIARGFWYAHVGWLLWEPPVETQKELDKTTVGDLEANPILRIQTRLYLPMFIMFSVLLPMAVAAIWNDAYNAFWSSIIRIVLLLHATWSVNSFAHIGGNKPYKQILQASESPIVSLVTFGEGWHNFHHSFPKDYRASEPNKYNPTTWFIDAMAMLGLARDRHYKSDRTVWVLTSDNPNDKFDKGNYSSLKN